MCRRTNNGFIGLQSKITKIEKGWDSPENQKWKKVFQNYSFNFKNYTSFNFLFSIPLETSRFGDIAILSDEFVDEHRKLVYSKIKRVSRIPYFQTFLYLFNRSLHRASKRKCVVGQFLRLQKQMATGRKSTKKLASLCLLVAMAFQWKQWILYSAKHLLTPTWCIKFVMRRNANSFATMWFAGIGNLQRKLADNFPSLEDLPEKWGDFCQECMQKHIISAAK